MASASQDAWSPRHAQAEQWWGHHHRRFDLFWPCQGARVSHMMSAAPKPKSQTDVGP